MRKKLIYLALIFVSFWMINGCCKDSKTCKGGGVLTKPFFEGYANFECQNNLEYTYIFESSKQIDSLIPTCRLRHVSFPIDETNMKYLIVGRVTTHRRDTFQTNLLKDTCLKTLVYEVNMVQRDTATWEFPGVQSMFCSVENIPADYKVSINYKYVPLK